MTKKTSSADRIAGIYAAAVGRAGLEPLADIVSAAMGVDSTGLWVIDNGRIADMATSAMLRETERPYLAHFHRLDPWHFASLGHLDRVVLGCELLPERDLLKTEFYNDFARPAGLFRPMGATVRLASGTLAVFGIEQPRTRLLFEEEHKRPLQAMLPHLRRALQLRLRQRRDPATTMHADALDALAFGVVVCAADGRIVLANKAADGLARTGAIVLGKHGSGLRAVLAAEAHALAALVNDAASGGPGGVLRLSGPGGCIELVALVTPLPRTFGLDRGAPSAYALVALRSPRDSPSFSADLLVALFGLSPTQAEIALGLHDGKTPEQIASERGVAISTLRTHLAEIFLRTATESQRDLVRLLGTLPPVRAQSALP
jgi:DNA-binding CsgD family transcriptional regulator/PAS domain-containing protein